MAEIKVDRINFATIFFTSILVHGGGGHWLVWTEWRSAGWSVCLPLLIFPCTIKCRGSLLASAHLGGPGKSAIKTVVVILNGLNQSC